MDKGHAEAMKRGIEIYRDKIIPLLDNNNDKEALDQIDQTLSLLDFSLPYLVLVSSSAT